MNHNEPTNTTPPAQKADERVHTVTDTVDHKIRKLYLALDVSDRSLLKEVLALTYAEGYNTCRFNIKHLRSSASEFIKRVGI